ncbi:MAG: hypothetical protein M1319_02440, partial [Chloroflexi bacterium]|nr:hypothetical protein [Chloroflexota bacterium]
NDRSVEGLAHPFIPAFSVQYHPEGSPGPQDNQYLFDKFLALVGQARAGLPVSGVLRPGQPAPLVTANAAESQASSREGSDPQDA